MYYGKTILYAGRGERKEGMKQALSEKSSLAWFKLAEYVGRKEKERALALYRLLIHSLGENVAFIKKLEADLLFHFDHKEAETLYLTAAHVYKQMGSNREAFLLYRFLAFHYPDSLHYKEQSLELASYFFENNTIAYCAQQLYSALLEKELFEKAASLFVQYESFLKIKNKIDCCQKFVVKALTYSRAEEDLVQPFLYKALDGLKRVGGNQEMNKFLDQIKGLNSSWYQDARIYVENM